MQILSYLFIEAYVGTPSGVERVVEQLVRHYEKLFPENHWRFLVNQTQYETVKTQLSPYWVGKSYIPVKGKRRRLHLKWILFNRERATQELGSNDIVYCPAEAYVPKSRAKLVCTLHDLWQFETDLHPPSEFRYWRFKSRILFRRMIMNADAIVTVSHFSASRIRYFFPEMSAKVHVVHNASHDIFGQPVTEEQKENVRRLVGNGLYVFKPGGMNYKKNSDLMMRAWPLLLKRYPQIKLVVTCIYKGDLECIQIARSKFGDSIIALDFVVDEILNALYQMATVVWVPSKYEGFGMPALEALACAKPLVVSRAGALPEVVADAALVCDRDSAEEHANAIGAFLDSSELRADYAARGLERAKAFSWDNSARQLDAVFKAVRQE